METAMKPVQDGRSRKRRWPAEQKLAVLQEWKNGVPLEEVCRKYALSPCSRLRFQRYICAAFKAYLRQTSSRGPPFFHSCNPASFCSAGHRRFRLRPSWTGFIAVSIIPPNLLYLSKS